MQTSERVVGFIPLRGGSKSIPLKNIRMMAGKPLAGWVIEAALGCRFLDDVVVCTDSDAIRSALAPYERDRRFRFEDRSAASADDVASTESVMLEFANRSSFGCMVLIQATSPLLTSNDLERGWQRYQSGTVQSVVSVVRQKRFLWREAEDGTAVALNYDPLKRPRRQEFPGFLVENGAFYFTGRSGLLSSGCRLNGRIGLVEMDADSYVECDEPEDWELLDCLLRRRLEPEERGGSSS